MNSTQFVSKNKLTYYLKVPASCAEFSQPVAQAHNTLHSHSTECAQKSDIRVVHGVSTEKQEAHSSNTSISMEGGHTARCVRVPTAH